MLIKWRAYNRLKRGTIQFQALRRGYDVRRAQATIKAQTKFRSFAARKRFTMLRSAVIALQCQARTGVAKKVLFSLQREQRDVGKLKQNNEKLKEEMASLRAMLSAQAKEGAANKAHEEEIAKKEDQIASLEKKIAALEKELEAAKAKVESLEKESVAQKEEIDKGKDQMKKLQVANRQHKRSSSKDESSTAIRRQLSGDMGLPDGAMSNLPSNYVSPEVLAEHRSKVARLEAELDDERRSRRETDAEIIRLRAKINGVELKEEDLNDLLQQKIGTPTGLRSETMSEESSFADEPGRNRYVPSFCLYIALRRVLDSFPFTRCRFGFDQILCRFLCSLVGTLLRVAFAPPQGAPSDVCVAAGGDGAPAEYYVGVCWTWWRFHHGRANRSFLGRVACWHQLLFVLCCAQTCLVFPFNGAERMAPGSTASLAVSHRRPSSRCSFRTHIFWLKRGSNAFTLEMASLHRKSQVERLHEPKRSSVPSTNLASRTRRKSPSPA